MFETANPTDLPGDLGTERRQDAGGDQVSGLCGGVDPRDDDSIYTDVNRSAAQPGIVGRHMCQQRQSRLFRDPEKARHVAGFEVAVFKIDADPVRSAVTGDLQAVGPRKLSHKPRLRPAPVGEASARGRAVRSVLIGDFLGVIDGESGWAQARAISSISTRAPSGSPATATVVRAG